MAEKICVKSKPFLYDFNLFQRWIFAFSSEKYQKVRKLICYKCRNNLRGNSLSIYDHINFFAQEAFPNIKVVFVLGDVRSRVYLKWPFLFLSSVPWHLSEIVKHFFQLRFEFDKYQWWIGISGNKLEIMSWNSDCSLNNLIILPFFVKFSFRCVVMWVYTQLRLIFHQLRW